jgi:hypothetical protein
VAGVAGLIAVLAGPAAYAMSPLSKTIEGSNPLAGPTAGGGLGGFAGGYGAGRDGTGRAGTGLDGTGLDGTGLDGTGGPVGTDGRDGAGRTGGAGGFGGLGGGTASKQLISYLEAHRDGATWLVAVQGSSAAASIILATDGIPVMAMGGFRGTDPAPTLAQFEQYVKQGKVHYVLTGGRGGFGGGGGAGTVSSVTSWVEQNCTAVPASAYGGTGGSGTGGSGSATSGGTGTAAGAAQTLYHCG